MPCDWTIEEELTSYVIKYECVSAVCRLSMQEEADLLDAVQFGDNANASRWWSNVDNVVSVNILISVPKGEGVFILLNVSQVFNLF